MKKWVRDYVLTTSPDFPGGIKFPAPFPVVHDDVLSIKEMSFRLPPLYPIIDTDQYPRALGPMLFQLADAGITWVQLRSKKLSSRDFFRQAVEVREMARRLGLHVIVNDRVDIALLSGASGVHVGQQELPVEAARDLMGKEKIIGISTRFVEQARVAESSCADYLGVGPVFATQSKEDPDPVISREELLEIRRLVRKPLVAIGGITVENAPSLYEIGIDSVAVIRDLMTAEDLPRRIRQYLAAAQGQA